jgi:hypothetical protein
MKAFSFRLEKALDWRRQQLELEENRYRRQAAVLADLDRARADLEASAIRAEVQVRTWTPLAGRDLATLARFREYVSHTEQTLAVRRAACECQLREQEKVMMEARRRCRLLERLRERRWEQWRVDCDREWEQFAAEWFLAGVARQRS